MIVIAAMGVHPRAVDAQGILALDVGWNPDLQDVGERPAATSLDGGPVWACSIFPVDFRHDHRNQRVGLRVITQKATASYAAPTPHAWDYRSTLIILDWERCLVAGSAAEVRLDVGAGFAWYRAESESYSNAPFGDGPDLGWVLSPGATINVSIIDPVSMNVGARGVLYSRDSDDIWPFAGSFLFTAGLEFRIPSRL